MSRDTIPTRRIRELHSFQRRRRLRLWIVVTAITVLVVAGIVALIVRLSYDAVTLNVDGQSWSYYTRAENVGDLLAEAHVRLEPEDSVRPDPASALQDGMAVIVKTAHTVALEADGDLRTVRTVHNDPADILDEQNIALGPYDVVQVDGEDYSADSLNLRVWNTPPLALQVRRGVEITVRDAGQTQVAYTTGPTVAQALDTLGLALYVGDRIDPPPDTPVEDGLVVEIERSFPVTLAADGRHYATRVYGPTIADALAAIGVAPVGGDFTVPALDTPPAPDMTIQLVRVTEELTTGEMPLLASTVYWPDPALPAGTQRVVLAGIDGLAMQTIVVRYEDGQPASQSVRDTRIVRSPAARVVALGTGPAR